MNARGILEAESPKGVIHAAAEKAKAEYVPTDYEKGVLAGRDSAKSLQAERYAKIKELRDQGLSFREIGERYNVSGQTIRAIWLKAQRMARQSNTPEEKLSNRAVNWLQFVLGVDTAQPGWGREAARMLGEKGAYALMKYRNMGPKLYTELRHWAQLNYGVKLAQPEEMAATGASAFKHMLPRPPMYEI